ncbi:SpoIIE family protein phosphatase [Pseudonocardia broussonetiae]|uniref:SpoIIE family protein phosphatase n=1 Tax=Pseudonocardia broussonetiae TaxID=2736640 RepID=A0A6M6JKZ0_9PSEU|nr:SpoIIE family protein phosphatase [Pseudonocardia broussonetiae]QJY48814.1 SpoIIE family protein phosphatase [Pseudonocardia broussonetiae]
MTRPPEPTAARAPDPSGAAAFEDLPTPVWETTGPDHRVGTANRAARELVGGPSPLGRPLHRALPGLDADALARVAAVRAGGAPERVVWVIDLDGRRAVLEADLVPVARPGPDGAGVLVQAREVDGPGSDRAATRTAQQALLPGTLPVLPGFELAGRYVPGAVATGGDWFDVVVTDDGAVVLQTGDVVGDGPAAAAAMASLRAVLRTALAEGTGLADALALLDRAAGRDADGRGAAVCVVVLDPTTGAFAHARCGHPAPAVRGVDGALRLLDAGGAPPLGLDAAPPVVDHDRLEPGETLLLHTRGLLARTGALPAALPVPAPGAHGPRAAGPADAVSDALLGALLPRPLDGDVALLAAHRRDEPVRELLLAMPADVGRLGDLRERLTAWLDALDVAVETLTALPLVVTELASNAVEHAYADVDAPGEVRVSVVLERTGDVRVVVEDDGRWRPDPGPGPDRHAGGLGLVVVHELARTVDIDTGSSGTRVTAVCAARRPAVVSRGAVPALRIVGDPLTLHDRPGTPPAVVVAGPVDTATVAQLRAAVLRVSAGGTRPVVVDLTAATVLSSAGVRLLHETTGFPVPPQVVAPGGTPSGEVLRMTGFTRRPDTGGRSGART